MADAVTAKALEQLLARLPGEHDDYDDVRRRVRLKTQEGRTFFAFVRAGSGKLAFAGWEQRSETTAEDEWEYFVLGAPRPGDPLQLIRKDGPVGVVVEAEMEDKGH
jgi:hypothetical protein